MLSGSCFPLPLIAQEQKSSENEIWFLVLLMPWFSGWEKPFWWLGSCQKIHSYQIGTVFFTVWCSHTKPWGTISLIPTIWIVTTTNLEENLYPDSFNGLRVQFWGRPVKDRHVNLNDGVKSRLVCLLPQVAKPGHRWLQVKEGWG